MCSSTALGFPRRVAPTVLKADDSSLSDEEILPPAASDVEDEPEVAFTPVAKKLRPAPALSRTAQAAARASRQPEGKATKPVANEAIPYYEVRVVDEAGVNCGVMAVAKGIDMAKKRGFDLVLFTSVAKPPVCKFTSLADVVAERKKAAADHRRSLRDAQPKEMRYTSRIGDHDLDVKTRKVVEFLTDGRPVRVTVSLTMVAWLQEEPARREVLAKVVRKVAESGVGYMDPSTIKGERALLSGMFNATSTPKSAAEVERTLAKLTEPISSGTDDPRMQRIAATVAAARDGTATGSTLLTLPPAYIMARLKSPKPRGGRLETPEGDTAETKERRAMMDGEPLDLSVTRGLVRTKVKSKEQFKGKKKTTAKK